MKLLFVCILFILSNAISAKIYVFSGGVNNVAHTVSSEILIKAYTRANIHFESQFLPLQEALNLSNSGITDDEIARITKITEFAPNLMQVPISIFTVEAVAFSKNISLKINKWADLKGLSLTIIRGAKFIETGTKELQREFVPTFSEAFERLSDDKTEVVVLPRLAAFKIIYEKRMFQIKQISPVLKSLELFHFVHKRNQHLISIIGPILENMKQSGEIDFTRSAYLRKITRQMEELLKPKSELK